MVWGRDGVWHWDPSCGLAAVPHVLPQSSPCPTALALPAHQQEPPAVGLGQGRGWRAGHGAEPPRQDTLLPSAGTAAGSPGTPARPSAGRRAAGGAAIQRAARAPAAAQPGPPRAALSPAEKQRVTRTGRCVWWRWPCSRQLLERLRSSRDGGLSERSCDGRPQGCKSGSPARPPLGSVSAWEPAGLQKGTQGGGCFWGGWWLHPPWQGVRTVCGSSSVRAEIPPCSSPGKVKAPRGDEEPRCRGGLGSGCRAAPLPSAMGTDAYLH